MNKREREYVNAFAAKLAKSYGWRLDDGIKYYEAISPHAHGFWTQAKMAYRYFRRKRKQPTKAQLWRRVTRLAGELIFEFGALMLPFKIDGDRWAISQIKLLIYVVQNAMEGDLHNTKRHRLVAAKLEAALAAWDAAT